jgi:hypothetical protein
MDTLHKLGLTIEDLRTLQQNSGSGDEYDKFNNIIKNLNEVYDFLVNIGE